MDAKDAILSRIRADLPAGEIEKESFGIIERECKEALAALPLPLRRVGRRLVHASADPAILGCLSFAHDPIESGLLALRRGAPLFCDANMAKSGISIPKLQKLCPSYTKDSVLCFIKDGDVVRRAKETGKTRALCAAQKALPLLEGAIVLVGNAPLCLVRIARAILEEGLRPALVIGMPVGFVNVSESKELLALCPVPQIRLDGRRGGSALAVAALHAVMESAPELS